MIKYILKRIVQVIPVLLGVSIIVFLMLSLSPRRPGASGARHEREAEADRSLQP